MAKTNEFTYEVVKKIGTISEDVKESGTKTKELRIVKWGDHEPSYDIRSWFTDDTETEKAQKGLTLNKTELKKLGELIKSALK